MDVISIALKKRQDVIDYRVHVEGTQRDEYPQVFPEITVTHVVGGPDLSEAAIRRCIELSATKYCPVNAMLSAGATVVHHRYAIHSTGASAVRRRGRGHRDRPVRPTGRDPRLTARSLAASTCDRSVHRW